MKRQNLVLILISFLFLLSSCQQRYWHVKKVRVHPEYRAQQERVDKQNPLSLNSQPDSQIRQISLAEPHFPVQALPVVPTENAEVTMHEPESPKVETETENTADKTKTQSASQKLVDDDEEGNAISIVDYMVLFAFFFTSLLLALVALYLPSALLTLLLLAVTISSSLGFYAVILLGSLFVALFIFLAYKIYSYLIQYAFPKKVDKSDVKQTFLLFFALLLSLLLVSSTHQT